MIIEAPSNRSILAIVLATLLLAVAGCGKSTESSPQAAADRQPEGEPEPGGDLLVALQADGKTLDPHKASDAASMRLSENLYCTLFRYAPEYGEIEPHLVADYAFSDDHLQLDLTLHSGIRFHSGRVLRASDVQFSLLRMKTSAGRRQQFTALDSVEVLAPDKVRLTLSQPMAPLLTFLAHPMSAILDQELVEKHDGNIDRVDAGSGPFSLVEWKNDLHCKMKRFDDYHVENRPFLDTLTFRPIPDDTARMIALRNNEIHMILDVAARNQRTLSNVPSVKLETVPGTFWEYLGMNTTRKPFDQVKVRQAVAWAIDRAMLNKLVKFDQAIPLMGGHIPPGHWAHAEELETYPERDLQKARELLAEAGYPDGFDTVLKVGSDYSYQVNAAEAVKQFLQEVGIDVRVQAMESSLFFDSLGSGNFDMTLVGWLGAVDPDEFTYPIFHTDAQWNQQGYSDSEVDGWLEAGRRTFDRSARRDIYQKVQARIARDAPMAFLYANARTVAMQGTVYGFVPHATVSSIFLRDTWLDE